ncbi:hypothetical protein [Tissierella praeacuta]|uniref:hypothetical protein n=1 Tax=Tissierella praeacuta TaxID=43131 RepID=UPI002FDA621E
MNATVNKSFVEFAEKEMQVQIFNFTKNNIAEEKAKDLAKEIVSIVDWNDSTLMHKGLSWIAKNFLIGKKIIES